MALYLSDVAADFRDYIVGQSTETLRQRIGNIDSEEFCLADYIQVWMESGDGMRRCHGDRLTFAFAVTAIIDYYWLEDPGVLYYVTDDDPVTGKSEIIQRHVKSIYGAKGLEGHPITSPYWFEEIAFRKLRDNPVLNQ